MRTYLSVFRLRRRMETQYRGAMIGGIICQVMFGLILIALYRALYMNKPQAMPLSHVVTYVWLQQAFFRMLLASDPDLMDKIRTGGIAYDLCRPVDLYGFYYVRIMAQKITGSLMRAVPMLILAALLPEGWGISLPASLPALLLSLPALLLGLLCVSALEN
ncbi:MAG: ABC transporter permease, partial [Clostridia bacterium]|nr:ABC transporter permease [Clostridia bacterium]